MANESFSQGKRHPRRGTVGRAEVYRSSRQQHKFLSSRSDPTEPDSRVMRRQSVEQQARKPYNWPPMTNGPKRGGTGSLSVLDSWRILTAPKPGRPTTSYAGMLTVIALLNVGALAALGSVSIPDPLWAVVAGLIHTAVVPGVLLAIIVLPHDEVDLAEWLVLAAGLALLLLILGGLLLALQGARISPGAVAFQTSTLTLVLGALAFKRGQDWRMPSRGDGSSLRDIGLLSVVAAGLRLPYLGYSEFQGDETEVMLRAAGAVQATRDALFYHGKGPGEIVVVSTLYGLVGAINEAAARLPFALAGVLGVLAFYLLARRLIGWPGALVAGLLLATNGFFLAFSRITQYQTVVLLLGTLAIWCAVRWSVGGSGVWPTLAGAFAATAALAHYDASFVVPPIVVALLWRTGLRNTFNLRVVWPWLRGAALGLLILAAFFVPYLTNPLFALATGRFADRVGAGFPYNNLGAIVAAGTLYLGPVLPLLVMALIVLSVVATILRRASAPSRRVWLFGIVWALVPFLFYAFVARKPGTHIHTATPGLMLLAGVGFQAIWLVLGKLPRIALSALTTAVLGVVGAYLVPIYLWHAPEIVHVDRLAMLPVFWSPPGGAPKKERFGFPYEVGWKAVGALYANGTLSGSYESNEQPQVTYWYTRGVWRCSAEPRYYVIADNVGDEIETPRRTIASQYHPIGTVTVEGQPKLHLFERGPATGAPQTSWPIESLAPEFDRPISAPTFDPGVWARGVFARDGTATPVQFGDAIQLLGYQLYAEDPRPGGVVRIDLFWLPHVNSDEQHRIDVQVGREPRIGDGGGPACDKTGDDRDWKAGQPFVQRLSVPIAASAGAGTYPILVSVSRLGDGGGPLAPTAGSGVSAAANLAEIGQIDVVERDR
jgi:4-amino-4-deoxy-L-arabinose transferase-like glycosyltransferase